MRYLLVALACSMVHGFAFPISDNGDGNFTNPVIWSDVPDVSVIRVDDAYYMVSTTMHMAPGIPVMKSKDLANWHIVNYCYAQIDTGDAYALKNGKNDYASGSWASNIRYDKYQKRFYVINACNTTDKSYIFSTDNIEGGAWHCSVVAKCYDPGLLFEDTGSGYKRYVFYGQGKHFVREILVDPHTFDATLGPEKVWKDVCNIENPPQGLNAEGATAYKIGNYYYLFMIQGLGWQRQEIVWRGKSLDDPAAWEVRRVFAGGVVDKLGRKMYPSTDVAQGGIVDTPEGKWYAFLFQDYGSVGRMPVLIPLKWSDDGWPTLGNDGKSVDAVQPMPDAPQELKTDIVVSDEFDNGPVRHTFSDKDAGAGVTAGLTVEQLNSLANPNLVEQNEYGYNGSNLKLQWQWNHNPNNNLWSLTDRSGYLRLKSGLLAHTIRDARNTLTQRSFGPASSGSTSIDVSHMKNGDFAGLAAFQNQYGFVGVKMSEGHKFLVMQRAQKKDDAAGKEMESIPLDRDVVFLKVDFNFGADKKDVAYFYYSYDGTKWVRIGDTLTMKYDWPDFVGYRFGLFYFSTQHLGGCVDFDYFHVTDQITALE